MDFEELVADVKGEVVAQMDWLTRCMFSLSCKAYYSKWAPKNMYGNRILVESLKLGAYGIARCAKYELRCPDLLYAGVRQFLDAPGPPASIECLMAAIDLIPDLSSLPQMWYFIGQATNKAVFDANRDF